MAAFAAKSGIDAITIILNNIRNKFMEHLPTYAIYMDIKDCYPSQHYDIMINRLNKYYGITGNILNIIKDLLLNNWAQTIVNGYASDWMVVRRGLGQGNVISQLLNVLFLDPINRTIKYPKLMNILSFVDDYLMYTTLNKPLTTKLNQLIQDQIDTINIWLKRNKMKLKHEKTDIIVYSNNIINKRYANNKITLKLNMDMNNNHNFVISNGKQCIKYLGSMMAYNLHVVVTIGRIVKRVNYVMYRTL
eukprot:218508_1